MRTLFLPTLICCLLLVQRATAETRSTQLLSDTPWQFTTANAPDGLPPADGSPWQTITLPHVFSSRVLPKTDILQGWYRRDLNIAPNLQGHRLYLVFEGVGTVADVYVNGTHLGQHRGAYTRFIFDATDSLHPGSNAIAVHADNSPEAMKDCLPDGNRLYTVYGGLYRKVWLLATNPLHIDPTDYASPGVYITPTNVTADGAELSVNVLLKNTLPAPTSAVVHAVLLDPSDKQVLDLNNSISVEGKANLTLTGHVDHPQLYSPTTPALYHVRVDVMQNGQLVDSVSQPTGFRKLVFQNNVVTLNGSPIVLAGTDLHQEIESKAAAMNEDDFRNDYALMKDLGFNWVRLCHYPHAQLEYDLCDQLGIFCWAENGHTNRTDMTGDTAMQINNELVKQNYNHPSIAIWSAGNESSGAPADKFIPLIKSLDPTRPVCVANMPSTLADFHGINTYDGWYGRNDMYAFKGQGYITEVGAGGVVTVHTDYASAKHTTNKYEPEEYQQLFAESHLQTAFRNNDKLGIFTWWCMRDFDDRKYKNSWNTKGLVTYSGDKKDIYYLFRTFLNPSQPTVWITSKRYFLRTGDASNGIKAYSNAAELSLTLNGIAVSTLKNGQYQQPGNHPVDNVFYWPVPLNVGRNSVRVSDTAGHSDEATLYYYPPGSKPEDSGTSLIANLTSSNPNNTPYYMDMPVAPEWPIYYDLDTNADNSFAALPEQVKGATWIATRRLTKAGQEADISFTLARPAQVWAMCTSMDAPPTFLSSTGFKQADAPGLMWRNNDLYLAPAQLYSRNATAGETIRISGTDRDCVIMLKE